MKTAQSGQNLADALNRDCHCISLDRQQLERQLRPGLTAAHAHLFAPYPVFVARNHIDAMQRLIDATLRTTASPEYQRRVFLRAPEIASIEPLTHGVFFGYDFHLTADGPQLIEINTNAGGVLLHQQLAQAQKACCEPVAELFDIGDQDNDPAETFGEMFELEWHHFCSAAGISRPLRHVAIVDREPQQQFLYPEFLLFRDMLEQRGVRVTIADPGHLFERSGKIYAKAPDSAEQEPAASEHPFDLVYNRLTDFYLEAPECSTLARAYEQRAIALTPAPRHYALLADKRNLELLSDPVALCDFGLSSEDQQAVLAHVPRTFAVTADEGESLWSKRKQFFFKPATGHGSRGSYDGAKLTRKVFATILEGGYVAQAKIPPSTRSIRIQPLGEGALEHEGPGEIIDMKVDLRAVVYEGRIQQVSARLYRGQTTNMRTEGGGLATVFTTGD